MSVVPHRVEQAVTAVETTLSMTNVYVSGMRADLARCDWTKAAVQAAYATAAFEAHMDAVQAMYRTMARA